MIPSLALDRSIVTIRHDEVVNALLELTAPAVPTAERAPLDIVAVIDRSGSMAGEPLRAVIDAVADLLRIATSRDRIAVVTFDSSVQVVLPLETHDRETAVRTVRGIVAGGSTNLSGGWLRAVEILAERGRPEAVQRVVLLTDGHANHGITDREQLATMVRGATTRQITSSFIGFASGYDEELLAGLADAGRGNDYFCGSADAAGAVFRTEFDGLATVAAQNVSVEIAPNARVATTRVRNEFAQERGADGRITAQLGDVYSEETRRLLVELTLRPLHETGPVEIATVTIRWTSVVGAIAMHSVEVPIVVTGGTSDETRHATVDRRVVEQLAVLDAADAEREARQIALDGDIRGAVRRLREGADRLRTVGRDEEARLLEWSATDIEATGFDSAKAKRLWSANRSRSRGRSSTFDPSWGGSDPQGHAPGSPAPGSPMPGSPATPADGEPGGPGSGQAGEDPTDRGPA